MITNKKRNLEILRKVFWTFIIVVFFTILQSCGTTYSTRDSDVQTVRIQREPSFYLNKNRAIINDLK